MINKLLLFTNALALVLFSLIFNLVSLLLPPTVSAQTATLNLPVGPNTFLETFTGPSPKNPDGSYSLAAPQLYSPNPSLDIMYRKRDDATNNGTMDPMNAHHGSDCSPFPATHFVDIQRKGTYICRDHFMTAMNGGDYGAIIFTPNRMVDFSQGEAIIRFDNSTLRTSARDWWDVHITPFSEVVPMPLGLIPDGYGRPKTIVIEQGSRNNFTATLVDLTNDPYEDWDPTFGDDSSYNSFLTESATRRDTFEIRISKTSIKFCLVFINYSAAAPGPGGITTPVAKNHCFVNGTFPAPLTWDKGVVQFGHHSYTPDKADNPATGAAGLPDTWHWDNIYISPSSPLTFIRTSEPTNRSIQADNPNITFSSPAPANTIMMINMWGDTMEASFNDGATWTPMTQVATDLVEGKPYMARKVNVPVGATKARFRGPHPPGSNGWDIDAVQVWSTTASTQTPTNTPTPTGTVASPTPTIINATPTTTRKPGDCQPSPNGDGDVDIFDYNSLVGNFGSTTNLSCDFVNPGAIDIFDYNTLVGAFGT